MNDESQSFLSQLGPVRRQLEGWRRRRKPRERIPENLWKAMTELAQAFGVSRVCQALRIEYHALKERVQPAQQSRRQNNHHPAFVELPVPTAQSQCRVELEDGSGAKMTLHLEPGNGTEVLWLVQAFWRRQP